MPESSTVTATELITELGTVHRRIDDGFTYLLSHAGESASYTAACRRWWSLVQDYVQRIALARKTLPANEIDALVTTYAARLERGWQMEPSDQVINAFSILVNQYMALCDLQSQADVLERLATPRTDVLTRVHAEAKGFATIAKGLVS